MQKVNFFLVNSLTWYFNIWSNVRRMWSLMHFSCRKLNDFWKYLHNFKYLHLFCKYLIFCGRQVNAKFYDLKLNILFIFFNVAGNFSLTLISGYFLMISWWWSSSMTGCYFKRKIIKTRNFSINNFFFLHECFRRNKPNVLCTEKEKFNINRLTHFYLQPKTKMITYL